LQDVAATAIVYEKALIMGKGTRMNFGESEKFNSNEIKKNNQKDIDALKSWYPFR